PDLDAIGYRLGVPYDSVFGHRGITHSLSAAILLAILLGRVAAGTSGRPKLARAAIYLFLCTASHGLVDAMTNGGLGVAFLAPLSSQRYFLPWRPILVSPLGVSRFFSQHGIAILWSELVWVWVPCAVLGAIGLSLKRPSAAA